MPTPRHEAYTTDVLEGLSRCVADPALREQVQLYAAVAEVLLCLDLEPARARLEAGLAPKTRGGKPRDVIQVWRVILLGLLLEMPRHNAWVRMMRGSVVLRIIAGLGPDDRGPGVGTLYDFEHRLHDGPWRPRCEHQERPSTTQRRRARSPQPKRETAAAAKRAGRPRPVEATAESVVQEIRARADVALPDDLSSRLNELLHLVAVAPSGEAGLLGALDHLEVACDTSVLPTAAALHGSKSCDHDRFERCECQRTYSDPDATLGYDASAKAVYYGHRFVEITTGTSHHDLPLAVDLNPAHVPDVVAGPRVFERLLKLMPRTMPSAVIEAAVFDAGFDAEPLHGWLIEHRINPVIPLKRDAPAQHPTREEVTLSRRGVPMCEAHVEMAPAGSGGPGTRMFTCPLRAGKISRCPLAPPDVVDWHCRPDLKAGPSVVIAVEDNPRLCPTIARNSSEYERLYKSRTTCERSNAMKKGKFKLLSARRRRSSGWHTTLVNIAILQHALAWRARAAGEAGLVQSLLRTAA